MERVHPLLERAQERFQAMGLTNVRTRLADGYAGWRLQAPFDAIVVTAAPPAVPEQLLLQLADGGRLIAPVGEQGVQELRVYDRVGDQMRTQTLEYVRFVPLLKGLAAR